jgi:hypothetical protein
MATALTYTTDELVARVRRTLQLRDVNLKLTPTEILQLCDEEIQQSLFPSLMRVREDYAVSRVTMQLTAALGYYRVPAPASSSTIDHIDIVQFSGSTIIGSWPLPRVEVPDVAGYVGTTDGRPQAFVIFGDSIQLLPAPDANAAANYALYVFYEARPSRLCPVVDCIKVASVALDAAPFTIAVTVDGVTGPDGLLVGDAVDIVPGTPPLGAFMVNGTIAGLPALTIFTGYYTFTPAAQLVAQITAGSYVTRTGLTCVFPLPDAWWSTAVAACSASVARVSGDPESYGVLRSEADASIQRLVALQSNRVRKQPHHILDRGSPQRRNARGWGRRGGL